MDGGYIQFSAYFVYLKREETSGSLLFWEPPTLWMEICMATVCDLREPRTKSRFFPGLFGPIGVFGQSPWIDPAYLQHWEYMFRPELAAAAASAAANPAGPAGGGGGPPTSTPTGSTSPASTTTSPAAPGFRLPLAGLINKVHIINN